MTNSTRREPPPAPAGHTANNSQRCTPSRDGTPLSSNCWLFEPQAAMDALKLPKQKKDNLFCSPTPEMLTTRQQGGVLFDDCATLLQQPALLDHYTRAPCAGSLAVGEGICAWGPVVHAGAPSASRTPPNDDTSARKSILLLPRRAMQVRGMRRASGAWCYLSQHTSRARRGTTSTCSFCHGLWLTVRGSLLPCSAS